MFGKQTDRVLMRDPGIGQDDGLNLPFITWMAESWVRTGGKVIKDFPVPHKVKALMGRFGVRIPWFKRKERVIVGACNRLESPAWPLCCFYEIIPFMWDLWPHNIPPLVRFIRRYKVKLVFCSSSTACRQLQGQVPGIKVVWIPEGIDMKTFTPGPTLAQRKIDIIEYGRRKEPLHTELCRLCEEKGLNHLYKKEGERFLPTMRDIAQALKDAKVVINYPRSVTNPEIAKGTETMTQRYWEGMLSKTLMVGHAPQELIEICGYNPVVEIKDDSAEQVAEVLGRIEKHQSLVDRNYDFAMSHASWDLRMPMIRQAMRGDVV